MQVTMQKAGLDVHAQQAQAPSSPGDGRGFDAAAARAAPRRDRLPRRARPWHDRGLRSEPDRLHPRPRHRRTGARSSRRGSGPAATQGPRPGQPGRPPPRPPARRRRAELLPGAERGGGALPRPRPCPRGSARRPDARPPPSRSSCSAMASSTPAPGKPWTRRYRVAATRALRWGQSRSATSASTGKTAAARRCSEVERTGIDR
jgi:hypothetical protein